MAITIDRRSVFGVPLLPLVAVGDVENAPSLDGFSPDEIEALALSAGFWPVVATRWPQPLSVR